VWALDYQFDQTTDGRILKLHVVDEHTRQALAIAVARRIDADATVAVLDRLVAERGTPAVGPLRQRPRVHRPCAARLVSLQRCGDQLHRAGSPWQNPYVERFGGRLRDELLAVEALSTLLEAQCWSRTGGSSTTPSRPHSALGYLTPTEYAKTWTNTHQPQLS